LDMPGSTDNSRKVFVNSLKIAINMKNKLTLTVVTFLVLISIVNAQEMSKSLLKAQVQYEIGGGAGHYNYAPSAIQDQYGIRYVFMCQNLAPFQIVDHIYLFKGIPTSRGYVWQPGTVVLSPVKSVSKLIPDLSGTIGQPREENTVPTEIVWDGCHICDPDVREFQLTYKGEEYSYIMTYLGVDRWDCNHNQIGLAFSKCIEGPWVKYDKNPLIESTSLTTWGVGQSTTIVLDSTTVQLFYSHNGKLSCRNIKLNDLDKVEIGEEKIVSFLHSNTYPAFSKKYIYAVAEERINQVKKEVPSWVGNHVRLMYKPLSNGLFTTTNDWKEIGLVGPGDSGFPRNHNPGLLTDTKGYMLNDDEAVVYFTVSVTGSDWLWSYDMYSATFDLKKINAK
jgi:hypothetical protein